MRKDKAEQLYCHRSLASSIRVYCYTTECMAWEKTGNNPDKTVEFGYCKLIDKPITNKQYEGAWVNG